MKPNDNLAIVQRFLITLCIILVINFFLPRMMPGNPFSTASSDVLGEDVIVLTEEQRMYYMNYYGLDRPLHEQFLTYLKNIATGDLGRSISYKCRFWT